MLARFVAEIDPADATALAAALQEAAPQGPEPLEGPRDEPGTAP